MSPEPDLERRLKPKRGVVEGIRWWWNTRIRSYWAVKLPALLRKHREQEKVFAFDRQAIPLTDLDKDNCGITVILTVYKRGEYLAAQVKALREQTIAPDEIWVWCNDSDAVLEDVSEMVDRVVVSNSNWKFWGRFALANMVRTRYVSLFDDDILPQENWFRNCLDTIAAGTDGILGGSGVILPAEGGYSSKHKVGWNGHHYDKATVVDLVGHAWFFDKAHLRYIWEEPPLSWENGEDIHFSCMALKHGGIRTYVPAHPSHDESRWSCRPDFGKAVGRTSAATFKSAGHHGVRDEMVDAYRQDGWQIVNA